MSELYDAVFDPTIWLPVFLIGCLRVVAALSEAEHEEEFYEPAVQAG